VAGALGVGAAVFATGSAGVLSGCAPSEDQHSEDLVTKASNDKDIDTLKVSADQVTDATDFERMPFEDYLKLQTTLDLPLGSLVYQMDSSFALVLLPGETGKSLRAIGMLNLATGVLASVLSGPVGTSKNVVLYDARASQNALIWVEFDLGNHHWSTYVASLGGIVSSAAPAASAAEGEAAEAAEGEAITASVTVGEPRLVEEGDADYEPPMLAVAPQKLYWTVMPVATGPANQQDSLFRALSLERDGAPYTGEPYTVLASHGRMITNPLVSNGIVTFVPRVDTGNIYYQLTALDCASDKLVDFRILPQSVKVADALYANGTFFFSIEGDYSYAEGLSKFGMYLELEDGTYLRVGRTPVCPAVRFGDCLVIQSTANIVGFDLVQKKSFVIESPPLSPKFGEALVGWGVQDKVVTSSVRLSEDGSVGEATTVRVFA
jgi:hypothetical protein